MSNNQDHHGGLAKDLEMIGRIMARRKALGLLAGVGTVGLLSGCGGSSSSGTTSTTTTVTPTASPTPSPTPTPTPTPTSETCTTIPTETGGPYPGDGTNTSQGSTSNVLTASGIVRSDIRPSFLTTTTVAAGTQVTLTLTVVDVNSSCGPLAGYAVYLWHCDRGGNYSLYSGAPAESYLRGVQVTNAAGQVTFTTIYPACYSGRFPHMHFEVFSNLANATSGRFAVLTSQLAMPAAASAAVFADATLYPGSASRAASVTTSNDGVFGDNTAAQIAAMTPTYSGSVSAGYTMAATIGIAR
jgi:protocatechuate 3,4-dioxygenase beta subunit